MEPRTIEAETANKMTETELMDTVWEAPHCPMCNAKMGAIKKD